jgi:hypothetical protein
LSPTARALLRRLLIKDPKRRLGAQRGAWIELRPHPFFQVGARSLRSARCLLIYCLRTYAREYVKRSSLLFENR